MPTCRVNMLCLSLSVRIVDFGTEARRPGFSVIREVRGQGVKCDLNMAFMLTREIVCVMYVGARTMRNRHNENDDQ